MWVMHLKSEIAQQTLSDLFISFAEISVNSRIRSAERVGFEPTVDTRSTTVFETAPFNHSGTSPVRKIIAYLQNTLRQKQRSLASLAGERIIETLEISIPILERVLPGRPLEADPAQLGELLDRCPPA